MGAMEFKIKGMDCAEEIAALKRELGPLAGGEENLSFDLLQAKMTVNAPERTSPDAIVKAVSRTGMSAERWRSGGEEADGGFWQRRGREAMTGASLFFLLCGIATQWLVPGESGETGYAFPWPPPPAAAPYAAAIVTGAWYVLPKAWLAARRLRPDMNLLMTVAVFGAVGIGEWLEAASVAFLFALSLLLESWSVGRARKAVRSLMDLAPAGARIRGADGRETTVPAEDVEVGATYIVHPGEKIPLDGVVTEGSGEVNQAPITGESMPVYKEPGSELFAGTINGHGALVAESAKRAEDATLSRIIRLVGEAQSRRAPAERWVERFARVYTPSVMALALLTMTAPPLALGHSWAEWFYRGLVLLVIACPCALVISTPVSIVSALTAAARAGILIKGGVYMELPARLRAIAFDKTGTLTEGRPAVAEVIPLNGHTPEELIERAAAMESRSEHPIARAILEYAEANSIAFEPASDLRSAPGKGVTARIGGREFWLGSHRWLEERGHGTGEAQAALETASRDGRGVVAVGNENHVCGLISVADTIRPGAREAVAALRALGIETAMLTGDNRETARAAAEAVGIDEFHAELLPEDKVKRVEALVERYGCVAMAGDGVNDAPALGRANLGIAMGAAGSGAAIETADIALMSDDLSKLPALIGRSKDTLRIIRQNIFVALGIKAVFVGLTFAGFASLWGAIAADMGASLLVIFNALRLLKPASD